MSDVFLFEPEQIRSVTGAKWLSKPEPPARFPLVKGVGLDSREDLTHRAFIAIKGERHDGHDHLLEAVNRGASILIVETDRVLSKANPLAIPAGVAALHVASTRKALGRIAHAHRMSLRGTKVIAVTGSSGKTTTKRLIHAVLSQSFTGVASVKSFNNDIGVPLTLLAGKSSDKYLVVEVGTNHPGEIADLAEIVRPDLAVITMIGHSHLQGLGSIEGVAREKGSLLASLSRSDGVAIINADYPLLRPHLKTVKFKFLFGENDEADLRLTDRGCDADGSWFEVNGRMRFRLLLPGKHNAINALAAIAVGRRFGLDDQTIAAGLLSVKPEAMRMTPQVVSGITFYNDAYNANPDSMLAALETFAELAADAPRRVLVLGDMLELGDASSRLHAELARHILKMDDRVGIDSVMLLGEHMRHAADELRTHWNKDRVSHFSKPDNRALGRVRRMLESGDAVLLKASRGMELERLVAAVERIESARPERPRRLARQS